MSAHLDYALLPFADGDFPRVVTDPIQFSLAKNGDPVTLFCINDASEVPEPLLRAMHNEFNYIVEEGLTYPHHQPFGFDEFCKYWFYHFCAVLVTGHHTELDPSLSTEQWAEDAWLGTFYVKPNYIGRLSHHCNAGFVVNHRKRGLGLGKEMGRKYLDIAPKLGYVYSVFNLVYELNVASLRIWDLLGFDRIGYVKNAGYLKDLGFVGAVMYGKDLNHVESAVLDK